MNDDQNLQTTSQDDAAGHTTSSEDVARGGPPGSAAPAAGGLSSKSATGSPPAEDHVALTDGILDEARREAQKIISEWENSRESRRTSLKRRIEQIGHDADERINKEKERIRQRTETRMEMAQRRITLSLQASVYQVVEQRAAEQLRKLVEGPAYDRILADWIVEACVGLNADKATVNCSAPERAALDRVLPDAVARASEITGRKLEVLVTDAQPLAEQGVVLVSADGQTGFSNTVRDRLRRRRGTIRRIVHRRLFGDEDNAGTDRRAD